jgi:hypothetical protein
MQLFDYILSVFLDPKSFTVEELRGKSISDLKSMLKDHGLSLANICEKEEMISRLVHSGKLLIDADEHVAAFAVEKEFCSPMKRTDKLELSQSLLASLPIQEIKSIMASYGIDSSACYERRDLIDRLASSSSVVVLEN